MPVAKTTSFDIEYGKKYPSFLFEDDAFQTAAN